jgi:hypothetical protein
MFVDARLDPDRENDLDNNGIIYPIFCGHFLVSLVFICLFTQHQWRRQTP